MFQVVKRDGEIAEFQMSKITAAIDKAFDAKEKVYSKDMIDLMALRVTADFQNKITDGKVTVEDIQDSVENVLIQAGYSDVAKAYILYRKQREKIRNMKSTILDYKEIVDSYVKVEDWRVKENSTVTYSVGGLILSNSGAVTANYWLSEIYDNEIADAHRNADIHIHDLSMLTGYCAGWSLKQLIKEGVTLLEIKSGYGLDLPTEEKILRVVAALAAENIVEISPTLLAAHATPAEYRDDPDGYITLVCETIMPQLWEQGLFETVDLFCESVGFSLAQSERVFQAAQALGIPIKGHVEQLSLLGGAQLVSRYHGLSADHIEYLDEAGVAAMSQSGTVGVLLPGAFYFLKEQQRPPVALLRQYQVPMAVATDFNPGTSPFISLHWAMNMACVQFGLTPEEAWAGVTRHAARALGRHATHGQLKAGFVADFVVWDATLPVEILYEPGRNPLYQRVFKGQIA